MNKKNTYYDVLEISENASEEDIKQAYRNLIKIWHPDLHPGDENAAIKTRAINEAYEVLSDPIKRPVTILIWLQEKHLFQMMSRMGIRWNIQMTFIMKK